MECGLFQKEKTIENDRKLEFGNIDLSYGYCKKVLKREKGGMRGLKILDIGTNRGSLPWKFYRGGVKEVYGIDVCEEGILSGKAEYKEIAEHLYYSTNARRLPFENSSFDIVCMFDVIEHIPDVGHYLKEVRRILKEGGIFIFQTPNKPMNIIFEIIRSRSLTEYKNSHCSLQTVRSLKRMLKLARFENVVVEKHTLYSEFNRKKVKKYFGIFGVPIMRVCSMLPLVLYPNLWGHAEK